MPRRSTQKSSYIVELNTKGMIINAFKLDDKGMLMIPKIAKAAISKRQHYVERLPQTNIEPSCALECSLEPINLPNIEPNIEKEVKFPAKVLTITINDCIGATQIIDYT